MATTISKLEPLKSMGTREYYAYTQLKEEDINACITSAKYLYEGMTTICVLQLRNGFKVTGESHCLNPERYSQQYGEQEAYRCAKDKVWTLEAYLCKERVLVETMKKGLK